MIKMIKYFSYHRRPRGFDVGRGELIDNTTGTTLAPDRRGNRNLLNRSTVVVGKVRGSSLLQQLSTTRVF